MFRASVYGINIIIETDEPMYVMGYLTYMYTAPKYNVFTRKMSVEKVKGHIYNRKLKDKKTGNTYFEIGVGWAAYLLVVFKDIMCQTDYQEILGAVKRPTYRTTPFPELRPHQNEDILHLLKYKFGLFSCFVGFGDPRYFQIK